MDLGNWYGSVAGIAAAAIACGGAVRSWLGDRPGFNAVPLVVYVLASCVGLSAIAQYVMGVALAPNFLQLLVMAGTACVVAVGGVGFVTNLAKPLAATVSDARNKLGVLLAIGLLAATVSACAPKHLQPVVTAENSVHLVMVKVDNLLDAKCDGGTLTPAFCKAVNAPLARAWAAKNLINRQLRNGVKLDTLTSDIAAFKAAVDEMVAEFRKLGEAGLDFINELAPVAKANAQSLIWGE